MASYGYRIIRLEGGRWDDEEEGAEHTELVHQMLNAGKYPQRSVRIILQTKGDEQQKRIVHRHVKRLHEHKAVREVVLNPRIVRGVPGEDPDMEFVCCNQCGVLLPLQEMSHKEIVEGVPEGIVVSGGNDDLPMGEVVSAEQLKLERGE